MRPLKIGRDGLVEFATRSEINHLAHHLEGHREATTKSSQGVILSDELITAESAPPSMKAKCPACDFRYMNAYELSKHLATSHGTKEKRKGLPVLLRALTSQAQIQVCPLCHSPIRQERLQKHMDDRCPVRNKTSPLGKQPQALRHQVKQPKRSTTTFLAQSMRQKGEIEVEQPSWRNNLDATKDCGYPAREEGRYGSYPSHDGFDDESKP
jgi:hypothetical protein